MGPGRLLWALRGLLLLAGAPAENVQHSYEKVKLMQLSVSPTATVQISPAVSPKLAEAAAAKEEEKTLNSLVGLLQDMVRNIPTGQAEAPPTTEPLTIISSFIQPSPSETVDTVWVNVKGTTDQKDISERVAVEEKMALSTTTAFWKLRHDKDASVVLHSDATTTEKPTQVVSFSDHTPPHRPRISFSLFMEKSTALHPKDENKSFDQLTNGSLTSLVESLKNVQQLRSNVDLANKPEQEGDGGGAVEKHPYNPAGTDILDLIDALIKTIENAPSSVKGDPSLHKYVETAESYLKNALELAAEAEKKLKQTRHPSPPEPTTELVIAVNPSPSSPERTTELVIQVHPSPPVPAPEPNGELLIEIHPTPSASPPEPKTDLLLEVKPSPATPWPEPTTELLLEVHSAPSGSPAESSTELLLEVHSVPSGSPAESSTELLLEVHSAPSVSPAESPTELLLEVHSAPSGSPAESSTELLLEVHSVPSVSPAESSTELLLEVHSVPSVSPAESSTELLLEVHSVPSVSPAESSTELLLEVHSVPSVSPAESSTELLLEVHSVPSVSPAESSTELLLEVPPTPSASSPESTTELLLEIQSTPSASPSESTAELLIEVHSTPESTTAASSTSPPEPEVSIELTPSPSTSLAQKAEDIQVKMGKLKAFINLLYGFSPQLAMSTENPDTKEEAEDIVERTMAVLDAIKSVFCGKNPRQSKKTLKQLLKKDMELVRQAMKADRVS